MNALTYAVERKYIYDLVSLLAPRVFIKTTVFKTKGYCISNPDHMTQCYIECSFNTSMHFHSVTWYNFQDYRVILVRPCLEIFKNKLRHPRSRALRFEQVWRWSMLARLRSTRHYKCGRTDRRLFSFMVATTAGGYIIFVAVGSTTGSNIIFCGSYWHLYFRWQYILGRLPIKYVYLLYWRAASGCK